MLINFKSSISTSSSSTAVTIVNKYRYSYLYYCYSYSWQRHVLLLLILLLLQLAKAGTRTKATHLFLTSMWYFFDAINDCFRKFVIHNVIAVWPSCIQSEWESDRQRSHEDNFPFQMVIMMMIDWSYSVRYSIRWW